MSGPEVITLGCRLNLAESGTIRALLSADDDVVVINSCAVTAQAVRATRQAIRRARRARPLARLVVTGCAVELEPDAFAAMPGVSEVVRNALKLDPRAYPFALNAGPVRYAPPTHARAFIAVQNGCDHHCTFCVTTLARGPSRSVPAGDVIEQVRRAVAAGCREAVLTGVDVTSYGADLPGAPTLGLLVERILRHVPALPRLRLSSLDSIEIDERLFDLIAHEPRVMPHVHLSLQSGDDLILKRMKRRHARVDAVRLVERLKTARPDVAIGADIIAGFPTETEAAFVNSLKLLEDCDIVHPHIFPYSARPGTSAARMPQLDRALVKARAAHLRADASERRARWLRSLVGTKQHMLVELDGKSGHAENFAPILLPAQKKGEVMPIAVSASTPTHLIATPA